MRQYTNIKTGEIFNMIYDSISGHHILFNEKREVKNFLASALTGTFYRLKDGSEIELKAGTFYEFNENTKPTHKKFFFEKRFVKINYGGDKVKLVS